MSVEVVLVPLAMAAFGAWQAGRPDQVSGDVTVCRVATRMRDEALLRSALQDTGAVVEAEGGRLVARWAGVDATFTRDADGVWSAHLRGDVDEARAVAIVTAVDQAYGRQVQAAVIARIRQRAPAAGMTVASETVAEDESVTFLLRLREDSRG